MLLRLKESVLILYNTQDASEFIEEKEIKVKKVK